MKDYILDGLFRPKLAKARDWLEASRNAFSLFRPLGMNGSCVAILGSSWRLGGWGRLTCGGLVVLGLGYREGSVGAFELA